MRYITKSIEVAAIQVQPHTADDAAAFCKGRVLAKGKHTACVELPGPGVHRAHDSDWIVCHDNRGVYEVMSNHTFNKFFTRKFYHASMYL